MPRSSVLTLKRSACALLALLLTAAAVADVLELNTGRRIRGEIVEETDVSVTLKVTGGTMRIARSDIRAVHRDQATPETRARALLESGEFSAAIDAIKPLLAKSPRDPELLDRLARAYARLIAARMRARRYSDAHALLRDADRHPTESATLDEVRSRLNTTLAEIKEVEARANHSSAAGQTTKAVALYEKLARINPEEASSYHKALAVALCDRGHAHFESEEFAHAADFYEKTAQYDPALFQQVQDRFVYARLAPVIKSMDATPHTSWGAHIPGLQAMLRLVPGDSHIMYHLALCRESAGKTDPARQLYHAIVGRPDKPLDNPRDLDALRNEALLVVRKLPLIVTREQEADLFASATRANATAIQSAHFRIHCFNDALAERVARTAEAAFATVVADIFKGKAPQSWPMPCVVTVYPTVEDYHKGANPPEWSSGISRYRSLGGVLADHSVSTYQTVPALLRKVLPHEVAHAVFSAYLGWPDRYPAWIQEGIALRSEGVARRRHFARVVLAARDTGALLPIETLTGSGAPPDDEVDVFYAESFYLTDYLIEKAPSLDAFLAFARALSTEDFNTALRANLKLNPATLQGRYHRFLDSAVLSSGAGLSLAPTPHPRIASFTMAAMPTGTR